MPDYERLAEDEKIRYHRQIILHEWGEQAQIKLKNSVVFIAGAGGLGSPVIFYLASAGVGYLRICDRGVVELSNLNRQIVHGESSIGKNKAESAKKTVARINSNIEVEPLPYKIDRHSVKSLVGNAHLIVDCLDNFETRFILNELSVKTGSPMIHAGVSGFSGQVTFMHPPETPCLSCLVPEVVPTEVFPILGATAGVVGSLVALEAVKFITRTGSLLKNRILFWNGKEMRFHISREEKNASCSVCGK